MGSPNYLLIKQLTNPRAAFCSLTFFLPSFLLPLSRCNEVGRVCINFLSSGTRRRSVETKFPKEYPNGRNPKEREERQREKRGIKTRYEKEKLRSTDTLRPRL
jgi:hypothetical protein